MKPPFERSYWAVPQQLLAGCYPGDVTPQEMQSKLEALVRVRISLVVNLMEENETNRSGESFLDYFPMLRSLAAQVGHQVRFMRFPIPDMSIPSPGQMREILETIHAEVAKKGRVYVHCWGGKGRTGTVTGCHLLETGRETQETVLGKIQSLTAHAPHFFWPTPQTGEQRHFVSNWRLS